MRFLAPILFVSALTSFSRGGPTMSQNWEQADAATVRLEPAAFSSVSATVREELERRGCVVPQSYSDKVPHNVVRGRFTSGAQTDVAVLCSKERVSSMTSSWGRHRSSGIGTVGVGCSFREPTDLAV
jgi:hypothetical protein